MKCALLFLLAAFFTLSSMSPANLNLHSPVDGPEDLCGSISTGSVYFQSAGQLTEAIKATLSMLESDMLNNPACRVIVVGGGKGNKLEQQISWENATAVISYMVDVKKIDRERFIINHSGDAPAGTVDYRAAAESEEGPSSLPPPFPH